MLNLLSNQPFLIILIYMYIYLFKNLFYIIKIESDCLILFLSFIFIFLTDLFFERKIEYRKKIKEYGYFLFIISLSLFLAGIFNDYSYDGQAYHQTAIIKLKDGWNPYYEILPNLIWENYYPKFTWIIGSFIYKITGNIEYGKVYNYLFAISTFIMVFKTLEKFQNKIFYKIFFSIGFTFNLIVIAQLNTFYVDGLMGMLILIAILSLLDYEESGNNKNLVILACVSIFAINIKFTGFIIGLIPLMYAVYFMIKKEYRKTLGVVFTGFIILILGVLILGYNPYIKNIIDKGHVFYPLFGKNKIDIMSHTTPEELRDKNILFKFLTLFLIDYSWQNIPFNLLKIKNIVKTNAGVDTRIAAFGIFYIEILILSFLIVIKNFKYNNIFRIIFPVIILIIMTILTPENWWGRYIPYFSYIPIFLLITLDYNKNNLKKIFMFIVILYFMNISSSIIGNTYLAYKNNKSLKIFVSEIKKIKHNKIYIKLENPAFLIPLNEKFKNEKINLDKIFYELPEDKELMKVDLKVPYMIKEVNILDYLLDEKD